MEQDRQIDKQTKQYYKANHGEAARHAYSAVLLFKMLLLGIYNNLSEYATAKWVNDLLCAARFCALEPEEDMPDYSILSRFRTQMTKHGAFDKLLASINTQLEEKGLMVKTLTR